nr:zinc finger, CCHC-type [Tanacetum cinerariifolium]
MSVVYVQTTHIPEDGKNAIIDQIIRRNKWDNNDCLYRFNPQILGHVHFKKMQDMLKDGLILAFDIDTEKCTQCIFVVYADHSKAFRFYVSEPNESISVNLIIESRDDILNETRCSLVPKLNLRISNETEDIGGSVVPEEKEAVNDEMDSIMGNNTWVLADLPLGCKQLGCKWIFKRKVKVDGTIEKFKARLMDVKTNFLNGELDEEVYMNQPQEFIMLGNENKLIFGIDQIHVDLTNDFLLSSNTEDSSSTSGWVFLLGGGAIFWVSKKQVCITSSTVEYEFMALAAAGKEAEWLKNFLLEVLLWSKPIAPISIRCDSAATLAKAYSQMYNGKSKHLDVRHSMIRELITNGVLSIEFVRSQQNLADHLTKRLARDLVIKSVEGMGLKSK